MKKIVALSDLHGNFPEIPQCDLLILAGDLCPAQDHSVQRQARWLSREFRRWLEGVPAKAIVGIAGNHDFVFERAPHLVPPDLPWTYLQDSQTKWNGLKIWGTPWQPVFYDWAFNGTPERLRRQWSLIPDDTDILIVHGPPCGFGDLVPREITADNEERWPEPEHCGCPQLLARIGDLPQLKMAVFGHIHSGRGEWRYRGIIMANVAVLDEQYRLCWPPMVWGLEEKHMGGDGELWPMSHECRL